MKPITLYVSNEIYSSYQIIAEHTQIKTSALIRNAMEYYMKEKLSKQNSLKDWSPLDLGNVKNDWIDNSFREEMLDDRY